MKTVLLALSVVALLAEPAFAGVAIPATAPADATVGVAPTEVVTRAGVAHRSSRRTSRRVNRRHSY